MSLRGLKLILQAAVCAALMAGPASALPIFSQNVTLPAGSANDLNIGDSDLLLGAATGAEDESFTQYFSFNALTSLTALSFAEDPGAFGKFKNLTLQWLESDGITTVGDFLLVTNAAGVFQTSGPLVVPLIVGNLYHLRVTGDIGSDGGGSYNVNLTATPIPPALLLFGTALAGLGLLGRRSRRRATSPLA